jgi:hypothetical protein
MTYDCDTVGTRPLCQQLRENGKHDPVPIRREQEEFLDYSQPARSKGSLLFALKLCLNIFDFSHNATIGGRETTNFAQVSEGVLVSADLHEPARRLKCEPTQREDEQGEHEVH